MITSLSSMMPSDYEFSDPDLADARVKWKDAMAALNDRQREQIMWVAMVLPKAFDRIGHSCSAECRPAIAAIEDGLLARNFKSVVDDVVYWLGVRHAEDHPGSTPQTVDDRLDAIDKASRWLSSRGAGGLPCPIREMLRKADGRIRIACQVSKEMSAASAA